MMKLGLQSQANPVVKPGIKGLTKEPVIMTNSKLLKLVAKTNGHLGKKKKKRTLSRDTPVVISKAFGKLITILIKLSNPKESNWSFFPLT